MLQWWRWHGPYFCASGAATIFNLLRRHACSWDYNETLWSLAETTPSTFVQTPFHLFMPRRWYSCSWFPLQSLRTQPLGQWGFSKKDILLENLRPPWTTFWMKWWNAEFLCLHPMQTSGLGARSVARCTMRGSTQCQVSFHDGSTHPTCVGTSCIDIQEDVQSWLQARCSGQKKWFSHTVPNKSHNLHEWNATTGIVGN